MLVSESDLQKHIYDSGFCVLCCFINQPPKNSLRYLYQEEFDRINEQSVTESLPLSSPVAQKVVAMRKKQQLSIGPCKSLPNSPSHSSVPAASIPSVHINQVRSKSSKTARCLTADRVVVLLQITAFWCYLKKSSHMLCLCNSSHNHNFLSQCGNVPHYKDSLTFNLSISPSLFLPSFLWFCRFLLISLAPQAANGGGAFSDYSSSVPSTPSISQREMRIETIAASNTPTPIRKQSKRRSNIFTVSMRQLMQSNTHSHY